MLMRTYWTEWGFMYSTKSLNPLLTTYAYQQLSVSYQKSTQNTLVRVMFNGSLKYLVERHWKTLQYHNPWKVFETQIGSRIFRSMTFVFGIFRRWSFCHIQTSLWKLFAVRFFWWDFSPYVVISEQLESKVNKFQGCYISLSLDYST